MGCGGSKAADDKDTGCGMPTATAMVTERSAEDKTFLQANYPKDHDGVKKEWLSKFLGFPLSDVSLKEKLENGFASDAGIFNLEYDKSDNASPKGPASIVLKYAKPNEQQRAPALENRMYEKEVVFYSKLHSRTAGVLPIPKVFGVFVDEEKPTELSVIAMEDLSVDFNVMDHVKGISHEEGLSLAPLVAQLHAGFWADELLKDPTVCGENSKKCRLWFGHLIDKVIADTTLIDKVYQGFLTTKCCTNVDLFSTDKAKTSVRLFKKHGRAIFDEFQRILDSRPFTLLHGDMRPANIMQRKPESGKDFKVLDWQTFFAGPPGVELQQLFGTSFTKNEDLERLAPIYELYLKTLHDKCPASKAYTMEMLIEDFTVACTWFTFGQCANFWGLFGYLPEESPLWKTIEAWAVRIVKTLEVLDVPGYVIKTCERLKLEVDPAVPFMPESA